MLKDSRISLLTSYLLEVLNQLNVVDTLAPSGLLCPAHVHWCRDLAEILTVGGTMGTNCLEASEMESIVKHCKTLSSTTVTTSRYPAFFSRSCRQVTPPRNKACLVTRSPLEHKRMTCATPRSRTVHFPWILYDKVETPASDSGFNLAAVTTTKATKDTKDTKTLELRQWSAHGSWNKGLVVELVIQESVVRNKIKLIRPQAVYSPLECGLGFWGAQEQKALWGHNAGSRDLWDTHLLSENMEKLWSPLGIHKSSWVTFGC